MVFEQQRFHIVWYHWYANQLEIIRSQNIEFQCMMMFSWPTSVSGLLQFTAASKRIKPSGLCYQQMDRLTYPNSNGHIFCENDHIDDQNCSSLTVSSSSSSSSSFHFIIRQFHIGRYKVKSRGCPSNIKLATTSKQQKLT